MAEIVTLGPPLAGLNLDTDASQIDEDEATELVNQVLHEDGQLRQRCGITARGFGTTYPPSAMIGLGNVIVHSGYHPKDSQTPYTNRLAIPYHLRRGDETLPSGWVDDYSYDSFSGVSLDTSSVPWSRNVHAGSYAKSGIFTPGAYYGRSVFYTTGTKLRTASYDRTGTSRAADTGARLLMWGGSTLYTEESKSTTVTNGSTSATLSSGTAGSVVGKYAVQTSSLPNAPYRYVYRVKSQSGTALTFDQPYGLGENTTKVPSGTFSFTYQPYGPVYNSPLFVQCTAVHYDRVFVARGEIINQVGDIQPGLYPNMISWSRPGEPQKWPETNFILVDDNQEFAITGIYSLGGRLYIFRERGIYVMDGYDEQSFTIAKLTDEIGCIDARSIATYRGAITFASEDGFYMYDGNGFTELTQQRLGHGVKSEWNNFVNNNETGYLQRNAQRAVRTVVIRDYMMIVVHDYRSVENNGFVSTDNAKVYLLHMKTGAWSHFETNSSAFGPNGTVIGVGMTDSNTYLDGQVIGSVGQNLVDFSDIVVDPSNAGNTNIDQIHDGTDTATVLSSNISSSVQWKDWRINEGKMTRLSAIRVDHNMHYGGSQSTRKGWKVRVSWSPDPTWSAGTEGTIYPRWEAGSVFSSHYYVTELLEGDFDAGEGVVVRVKLLSDDESGSSSNQPATRTFYRMHLVSEPTKIGIVDDDPVI